MKSKATATSSAAVSAGGNLFATAAPVKKAAAKKDEKENVQVTDPAVAAAIDTYMKNKEALRIAKAAMENAEVIVKEYGDQLFIKEMEQTGKRKESFVMSSPNSKEGVLFIVQDSYKRSNLDEDRICYLRGLFGDEIVTEETKFMFNAEMVALHGEQISQCLAAKEVTLADGSKVAITIPDSDRAQIIFKEVKPVITKGTIDKLRDIAQKCKTTVANIFTEIVPTRQLKVRGEK